MTSNSVLSLILFSWEARILRQSVSYDCAYDDSVRIQIRFWFEMNRKAAKMSIGPRPE